MKSVLVVDDEEALLFAYELALSSAGYKVVKALTGEEALFIVRDQKLDLILLDIMMPGIGGLETLKLLRKQSAYRKMPIVLMSEVRPHVRQRDYEWTDLIMKPFTFDRLLEVVSALT